MPVALPGKYLGALGCVGGMLWKSLWNWWLREKWLAVKICQPFVATGFAPPKTLNSNQLGN